MADVLGGKDRKYEYERGADNDWWKWAIPLALSLFALMTSLGAGNEAKEAQEQNNKQQEVLRVHQDGLDEVKAVQQAQFDR